MGQENAMICQKQFPITIDCCTNKAQSVILSLHFNDKISFGHTFFFEINVLFTSQLSSSFKSWLSYKSINIDLRQQFLTSTFVLLSSYDLLLPTNDTLLRGNYPTLAHLLAHSCHCLLSMNLLPSIRFFHNTHY